MTNASVKNSLVVLSVLVLATALSWGAFASTAKADDGGDYSQAIDYGGGGDYSTADYGGGYDYSQPIDYSSGCDASCGDYSQPIDYSSGCDTTCGDYSQPIDYNSGDCGCDYSQPIDTNCNTCVEEGGVTYSEETQTTTQTQTTPSYTPPFQPSYPQTPSYPTPRPPVFPPPPPISYPPSYQQPPVYYPQPPMYPQPPIIPPRPTPLPTPIPQPIVQQQQPNVVTTNNTCTNYSCNYTDNSINSSFNTAPIAPAPISYPVQYTFPQNISCTITASPTSIQSGQYSYLSWQSYGATSATLTNFGNVAPNGSLSIRPLSSANYVLTVYGGNGQTATCNTLITVGNTFPQVSLSQIPYTGFDFGTFGDSIYFAALALFALAAGYIIVYYKGGAGVILGSIIPTSKKKTAVVHATHAASPGAAAPKVATAPVIALNVSTNTKDVMSAVTHGGVPHLVITRA